MQATGRRLSLSVTKKKDRINEKIVKAADNQIDQLEPLFGREISKSLSERRSLRMIPMNRMHISGLICHLPDLDTRIQRGSS